MRQITVGPLYSLAVTLVTLGNYYGRARCFEPCRELLYFGPNRLRIALGVCTQTWTRVDEGRQQCCTRLAIKMKARTAVVVEGVYSVLHGRSCMTIHPRIPTMPGRSTSGFRQPGRHCLHQTRSA